LDRALRAALARLSLVRTSPDEHLEENLEAMREREGARLIRRALEGESWGVSAV
jgi:hypothetical protein